MLTDDSRTTTQQLMHTASGLTLAMSRFTPEVLPDTDRVGLDTACEPQDRPARIASTSIEVTVPGLPPERAPGLLAVVRHCTVKNTLDNPPDGSVSPNASGKAGTS
ncbi:hypothetical protein [Kitasatospora sp. NPDC054795]